MSMHRSAFAALALGCAVLALPVGAGAQQRAKGQATKSQPAKTGDTQGDAQLRGRIEQLEEQIADMQVVIGTLELLGRGGQAGPASRVGGGGGVDQAKVDSLETQVRAMASQIEQLSGQVRQLSGSRRGDAGTGPSSGPALGSYGSALPPHSPQTARATPPAAAGGGALPGFGSTTVVPGDHDPIGRMIGTDAPQNASAVARLPPSASNAANPRELYETAYGYLLQQDYGASEVAFEEFLRRYPSDRLASDAQYWLGETLYVQRRYKQAGQAFLAVVEKHKGSSKVPNSLLKLAQSLEQLGQKDCGIFSELEGRYRNAPADVRVKARALKQRQGC